MEVVQSSQPHGRQCAAVGESFPGLLQGCVGESREDHDSSLWEFGMANKWGGCRSVGRPWKKGLRPQRRAGMVDRSCRAMVSPAKVTFRLGHP